MGGEGRDHRCSREKGDEMKGREEEDGISCERERERERKGREGERKGGKEGWVGRERETNRK